MTKISKRGDVRLGKQRERQKRLRDEAKEARRPSRDDIARTLLHLAITLNLQRKTEDPLFGMIGHVVDKLAEQGFDKRQSEAVIFALVDKYQEGWNFLPKRHLQSWGDESKDGE